MWARTLRVVIREAGDFDEWAAQTIAAVGGLADAAVPCGECTACCTASQFIHVGPDESDALAHIPDAVLFPAPGRPRGHVLMGYDEHGRCPMFVDGGCSIYDHRPRTCRTYDCRIFPATGVEVGDEPSKAAIAQRAAEWEFHFGDAQAQARRQAMRAAASFVAARAGELFDGAGCPPPTQRAVLAVELHGLFLADSPSNGASAPVQPDVAAVRVQLTRRSDDVPAPRPARGREQRGRVGGSTTT